MQLFRPVSDADRGVPAATVRAFLTAVVEVAAPDGRYLVRPVAAAAQATPDFPARTREVAIVTAHNPGGEAAPDHVNQAAQTALARRLEVAGVDAWPALGRDLAGSWTEPSLAVPDLPLEEAIAIARRYDQAALFVWRPGLLSVVWTPPHHGPTADTRHAEARRTG